MNVAVLFNSDDRSIAGYYGPPVREAILATGVLQSSGRAMRVSLGDVLTFSEMSQKKGATRADLIGLCKRVYRPHAFGHLRTQALEATYASATVYCWVFQNMSFSTAESLDLALNDMPAYLGAMDVDFASPLQLHFFRNLLCEVYRLEGRRCSIFYHMGENEDPDSWVKECFEGHGFDVTYEDAGARHTIFDDYDSAAHFQRVGDFQRIFVGLRGLDDEAISNIVYHLEELHPALFDAFASAARSLERAETAEDLAQSALSGRRLLEQIADHLFPPRTEALNGRAVGPAQYRNRLWAYIEQTCDAVPGLPSDSLDRLGTQADTLVELFNAGLHADPSKGKVEDAFAQLVQWISEVVALSPERARKPYLAYEDSLRSFMEEVVSRPSPDDQDESL